MNREYSFIKNNKTIRIYGTTYGTLLKDKREARYIGKIIYDKELEEIIFIPQLGIMGQSQQQITYINQIINEYGEELK